MKTVIKGFFKKGPLLIICLFLFLRLIKLTSLPVFGDEAIYLDWGWKMIHIPGLMYYSLIDGKQPFLMWVFGIGEIFIQDPLTAGRLVSIGAGLLVLIGVYKIADLVFSDKRFAYLSAILYTIIPIFSFFDRQALMESAISAAGVWSIFWYVRFQRSKKYLYSLLIGFSLGIGFFIKSSILIYLATIVFLHIVSLRDKKYRSNYSISSVIIFSTFFLTAILLFIQPNFWSSLQMTSRYSLTFPELLRFPISTWAQNLFTDGKVLFASFTPLLFILSVVGLVILFKRNKRILFFLFLLPVILQILLTRGATDRYLVSFLPLLIIPAVLALKEIFNKNTRLGKLLLLLTLSVPLCLTIFQIFSPAQYILTSSKYFGFADTGYIDGYTSGYGIPEVVTYLNQHSQNKLTFVAMAGNVGNPESAIMAYFRNHPTIKPIYFDQNQNPMPLDTYNCISFEGSETSYFISREDQMAGLNRFLKEEKRIDNPYGTNTIGIYSFKKDCGAKTLTLYPSQ